MNGEGELADAEVSSFPFYHRTAENRSSQYLGNEDTGTYPPMNDLWPSGGDSTKTTSIGVLLHTICCNALP